jgi:serine/threonine-protein kinase
MTDVVDRLTVSLADRYRLEGELGQGGMATVYLAHDLRHDRKVALKVLRAELAAVIGAERFLHEIKTTANLQHPHILGLHDSGQVDGTVFYVMPFVEGESLRQRMAREKQLPVDEAVRIAREVASALDYAHRHGVIHRDIKPENILLHDGSALVADFGIALAASKTGGNRMTETGMSLGTPHYMSPEQAMGERELDARSDVYALGCVLYEMLAGEPPFTGPTAQAIIARVVTEDPRSLTLQRKTIPANVEASVQRALQKLPADRFGSAAEFASALVDSRITHPTTPMRTEPAAAPKRTSGATLLVGAAAVAFAALAAWGWLRSGPEPRVTRFAVALEDIYVDSDDAPGISPDGRLFIYGNGASTLVLRQEGVLGTRPIVGSENGWSPFFAPNGSAIGFMTGFPGDLKVMTVATGAVTTIAGDSVLGYGGSWSDDNWIYYTTSMGRSLMRMRPSGAEAELVAKVDSARDEFSLRWPHALPGGKSLLLTAWRRRGPPNIVVVDVESGSARVITQGLRAWFVPTGHLVAVKGNGSVVAIPFDLGSGDTRGQAVELIQGVRTLSGGTPFFDLSRSGTVVYGPSNESGRLMRVDRTGQASVVDPAWAGELGWPSLSPDGSRMAISNVVEGRREVWVKTLESGPFQQVAAVGSMAYRAFWSRDERTVGFVSDLGGLSALYQTSADGTGALERIVQFDRSIDEGLWSHDGRWFVFRAGSGGGRDIFAMRPGIDSVPVPIVAGEKEEYAPSLSPDGRWLAYGSDASGREEIFVRPFPESSAGRWQVSLTGGTEPVWSPDGRELFYRSEDQQLVAVAIDAGPAFRILSRRTLFSTRPYHRDTRHYAYAVGPDRSFYFVQRTVAPNDEVVVIHNWLEELKVKVPQ